MKKLIAILLTLYYCNSFGQLSTEFGQIMESESCKSLIDTIKNNWIPKSSYYKSKFTPRNTGQVNLNLPCIKGIKRTDSEILFGTPIIKEINYSIYYTSKPYKGILTNSFLKIGFYMERINSITETNCNDNIANQIKENFIKHKSRYICKNIPKKSYVDTIKSLCLNSLTQDDFETLIGKPTLKFKAQAIMAMDPVEWDDKGNEVVSPKHRDQLYFLRYITDTIGKNRNSGFEVIMELERSYIISYNCESLIDSIQKKWHYDSLNVCYSSNLTYIEIQLLSRCLYGLDSTSIIKTLGIPSDTTRTTYIYYTSTSRGKNNRNKDKSAIDKLRINLNKYGRLESVQFEYGFDEQFDYY